MLLSLGLSVIFGLLNIVNFSHGVFYMLGAFTGWMLPSYCGLGYWWAFIFAPIIVGALGMIVDRTMIAGCKGSTRSMACDSRSAWL